VVEAFAEKQRLSSATDWAVVSLLNCR
jgi:hypothetical protein